jgi:hypothetical protein
VPIEGITTVLGMSFFLGPPFLSTRNIVGVFIIIRGRIWGVNFPRGGGIQNNCFRGNEIAKIIP